VAIFKHFLSISCLDQQVCFRVILLLIRSQQLQRLIRSVISDPSFQGNFEHLHSFHQYVSESVRARTQLSLTSLYLLNYLIFHSTIYVTELCKINVNIVILFLLHFIKTLLIYPDGLLFEKIFFLIVQCLAHISTQFNINFNPGF